jgi:hypothetical protein
MCCLNLFLLYLGCLCVVLIPHMGAYLGCPPFFILFLVQTYPWFLGHCYFLGVCLFLSYLLLLYLCGYFSNENWNPLVIFPILNGQLYVRLLDAVVQLYPLIVGIFPCLDPHCMSSGFELGYAPIPCDLFWCYPPSVGDVILHVVEITFEYSCIHFSFLGV